MICSMRVLDTEGEVNVKIVNQYLNNLQVRNRLNVFLLNIYSDCVFGKLILGVLVNCSHLCDAALFSRNHHHCLEKCYLFRQFL